MLHFAGFCADLTAAGAMRKPYAMLCSTVECSILAGFCADLTAAGAMRKPYAMLCSAVECSILAGFCTGLTAAGAMRKPLCYAYVQLKNGPFQLVFAVV